MVKISTQNYKGTRDFYPEDMRLQRYIFDSWRRVAERFGYEEHSGPLLEFTDLYRAKTGEEIVSEQTYSFKDRGGRDVTMRPEMTPTTARMVAARQQELPVPIRWYSIPNLWRYERPQHGRLREHWQLNADLFGVSTMAAEREIITLAYDLMHELGADESMFIIKLNSRELMSYLYGEYLSLSVDAAHRLSKLLDHKNKISEEAFINQADVILGDKLELLLELLKATKLLELPEELRECDAAKELYELARDLHTSGISNIRFDLTIQRGFDYYTGTVFEIFDRDPDNPRSLFGGGRYDELLRIFGAARLPAVGFGVGDVTMVDFLRTHRLVPELRPKTRVVIATLDSGANAAAEALARKLRRGGVNAGLDETDRKLGAKIKAADKLFIPYVIVVGEEEIKSQSYKLKELASGEEKTLDADQLVDVLS